MTNFVTPPSPTIPPKKKTDLLFNQISRPPTPVPCGRLKCTTAPILKFSIKDFFSKCDQIRSYRSFLRIWWHLLKKSIIENFIFCAVYGPFAGMYLLQFNKKSKRKSRPSFRKLTPHHLKYFTLSPWSSIVVIQTIITSEAVVRWCSV